MQKPKLCLAKLLHQLAMVGTEGMQRKVQSKQFLSYAGAAASAAISHGLHLSKLVCC